MAGQTMSVRSVRKTTSVVFMALNVIHAVRGDIPDFVTAVLIRCGGALCMLAVRSVIRDVVAAVLVMWFGALHSFHAARGIIPDVVVMVFCVLIVLDGALHCM